VRLAAGYVQYTDEITTDEVNAANNNFSSSTLTAAKEVHPVYSSIQLVSLCDQVLYISRFKSIFPFTKEIILSC
jgi:hypothetical protein